MKRVGFGTERVVESLAEQFPQARVASLDSSVTRAKQMTAILETFRQGKLDILVGTQVIAKGHDFPNVTLVGVLLADLGLSFPDFRAAERTFQLLTQVAGRAGRGDKTGRVVVQTYMPDHVSLVRAQRHDFLGFSQDELRDRLERHFPPFSALALLRFSGEQHDAVEEAGVRVMQSLGRLPAVSSGRIQLLGPTRAPLAIVRKRLRMQILVRAPGRPQLKHFIDQVRSVLARPTTSQRQISWDIDMDPVNMM
jgi:primosomal protein N' (replication factor Y)